MSDQELDLVGRHTLAGECMGSFLALPTIGDSVGEIFIGQLFDILGLQGRDLGGGLAFAVGAVACRTFAL